MTNEPVVTKDYWTIILLTSAGFSPEKIDSNKKESGSVEKVYTFIQPEANTMYQDYIAGKEIPINFHSVETAANLFKKNLHPRR